MTRQPERWSDAASDADPVLRAVLRYAQSIEPSPSEVAACAAAVARAESTLARASSVGRRQRGWSRRTLLLVAAVVVVVVAGSALAMTFLPSWRKPLASVTVSKRQTPPPTPKLAGPASQEQPPAPEAPLAVMAPSRARAPSATPDALAAPSGDLELLNAARQELRKRPARALSLLATHVERFPGSAFGEERAALRVEALYLLGRSADAEREHAAFNAMFPGSIYQLRLNAMRGKP